MLSNTDSLKFNLETFTPGLIKLIGDNPINWDDINNAFNIELSKRLVKLKNENKETLIVSASLYDIIISVRTGNIKAMRYLDFLNKVFLDLDSHLLEKDKKLVLKNIIQMLKAIDKRYISFVSELAVLNNLLKSKEYTLENIELRLPNNASIDFVFNKVHANTKILVEVLSFDLDTDKVEDDEDKIKAFLSHRLNQKISSKKKDLKEDVSFFLVPVIWGAWEDLQVYSNYFKREKMHVENVTEPLAYLTFFDPNDETYFIHRFGNIRNLFNSN